MYALPNKTQHKLIVKVRGGISQKLDNFTSSSASTVANSATNSNNTYSSSLPFTSASLIKESAFNRHVDEAGFNAELSHLPQPVFHTVSSNGSKHNKSPSNHHRAPRQHITPEHDEMIKYVQQSWKGVEQNYKKSVNNFINNLDMNNSPDELSPSHLKQKQASARKKTATTSTPLLLTGSYHHISTTKDSSCARQDSFQPFDLETFWGNRILKRLTEET